jgi:hypothetical protein
VGRGLNPGWIAPTPFYNTTDVAQSKFNWGMKGYQEGPRFNAQAYNQAPGSATPWGLQQLAKPLTQAQIADIIAGRPISATPTVAPATRAQAYNPASMVTPNANNVFQLPTVRAPVSSNTTAVSAAPTALEQQLAYDQQLALAQGNDALYWDIQARLDALKKGTTTTAGPVAPTTAAIPSWMPPGTTTRIMSDGTTGYIIDGLIYDQTGSIIGRAA